MTRPVPAPASPHDGCLDPTRGHRTLKTDPQWTERSFTQPALASGCATRMLAQREGPGDQKRKADFIPHKGVLILVSKISQEAKRSPEAAQPSPTRENKIEPLPLAGNKSCQKDGLSGPSLSA